MRTCSSSNLPVVTSNLSTSNPKHRNRRRSKQPFILEESPVDTMADQRTMAELLRAPTEGYAEAIVVPPILADQFELKHNLINMMTTDQFFGLEKENPHDHICWFNKITSIIKYKDVPNSDCAQTSKNQSKTGQYQHKNGSQQQKPDQQQQNLPPKSYTILISSPGYSRTPHLHQILPTPFP
nr:reverse transcriptase domain-containing protein [Tanacetum cinerariifolium]GEV96586.1 reverse transcriptase domain-containing protein [Tanacetum cinerariifolium]